MYIFNIVIDFLYMYLIFLFKEIITHCVKKQIVPINFSKLLTQTAFLVELFIIIHLFDFVYTQVISKLITK